MSQSGRSDSSDVGDVLLRLTVTENFAVAIGRENENTSGTGSSALLPLGRRTKRIGLEARFDAGRNVVVFSSQFVNDTGPGAAAEDNLTSQ